MKRFMQRRAIAAAWITIGLTAGVSPAARAWHEQGHAAIAEHAVRQLPASTPAFFRQGAKRIGHASVDPDVFKLDGVPQLQARERPEHFLDIEKLDGAELPKTRYKMIALMQKKGLDPARVGLLPYAIMEWQQRLTVAFAEYQRWPSNPHIRAKCLIYAGNLAHYTGDLAMPLHTTVHYDGRLNAKGESPHTGIHARVDRLLRKIDTGDTSMRKNIEPRYYENLMPAIMNQFRVSHQRVDRVYSLKDRIPPLEKPLGEAPAVRRFARTCFQHGTRFTASMFLTAWRDAKQLKLPDWLDRGHTKGGAE